MAGETGGGTGGSENRAGKPDLASIFDSGTPVIDPADIGTGNDGGNGGSGNGGDEPKRRGRKPGSKNKTRQAPPQIDLAGVEKLLLSAHSMLAAITKIREFELDESEARSIATAIARVTRHYPILDKISDSTVDHANLFSVLAGTYGTRIFAYKTRAASENARDVGPNVTTLHPHGTRTS